MNPELEQLAQRAVGALLNGLYQGLLLALVFWLGLKIFRGTNAATRHAVGFVVMLLVTLLPCLHFLMPGGGLLIHDEGSRERVAEQAVSPAADVAPATALLNPFQKVASLLDGELGVPEFPDSRLDVPLAGPKPVKESTPSDASELPSQATRALQTSPHLDTALEGSIGGDASGTLIGTMRLGSVPKAAGAQARSSPPPGRRWQAEVPGIVCVVTLASLGVIAAMRLLRLASQWLELMRLKRTATPPSSELTGRFAMLLHELKVDRPVRLLVDDRISTPMAVGYFRPAVLLPAALVAGPMERALEGILRHELAHIQRRDDWCNLLQQVIAGIQFYHPAVAWLSRRLTIDREVACDDIALARSASRRDYALLLTEFAGRNRNREWIAAPAAWSNRSQLKERIRMILDPNRNTSQRLARTSAGALTLVALATSAAALVAGPRLVLAASADTPSTRPLTETDEVALVSRSGDELIAHVGAAPPPGVTISVSSDVEWNADHNVSHAVAVARGPEVAISARPAIKVVPGATLSFPGHSGFIVAHGAPPEPAAPADARPPKAPKPGRAPKALPAPAAAPSPEKSGESMEQRLERLERMLEQLVGGDRKFHFDFQPGKEMELKGFEWHNRVQPPGEPFAWNVPNPGHNWPTDEAQRKAVEDSVKVAEKEIARAMKEAQKEMARAGEEVEKARRDGELRAQLEMKREFGHTIKETELQRKALEGQRRSIEREMQNLNRHMERLEQQLGKLDEQMERLDEREEDNDEREEPGDVTDAPPRVKEKANKP